MHVRAVYMCLAVGCCGVPMATNGNTRQGGRVGEGGGGRAAVPAGGMGCTSPQPMPQPPVHVEPGPAAVYSPVYVRLNCIVSIESEDRRQVSGHLCSCLVGWDMEAIGACPSFTCLVTHPGAPCATPLTCHRAFRRLARLPAVGILGHNGTISSPLCTQVGPFLFQITNFMITPNAGDLVLFAGTGRSSIIQTVCRSMFSHVAMVYKDESSGEIYVLEALHTTWQANSPS